jgi:hypothetical protein
MTGRSFGETRCPAACLRGAFDDLAPGARIGRWMRFAASGSEIMRWNWAPSAPRTRPPTPKTIPQGSRLKSSCASREARLRKPRFDPIDIVLCKAELWVKLSIRRTKGLRVGVLWSRKPAHQIAIILGGVGRMRRNLSYAVFFIILLWSLWIIPAYSQSFLINTSNDEFSVLPIYPDFPAYLNDSGQLVNFDGLSYNIHTGSSFNVQYPGHTSYITGINDNDQYVGRYVLSACNPNGGIVALNVPGAVYTLAFGLNDNGQVDGLFYDPTISQRGDEAFLYSGGEYAILPAPSGYVYTQVSSINDLGEMVGTFAPIPELPIWAMLILGLAGLAYVASIQRTWIVWARLAEMTRCAVHRTVAVWGGLVVIR